MSQINVRRMAPTAAEKQKRYRERLQKNPEKYEVKKRDLP